MGPKQISTKIKCQPKPNVNQKHMSTKNKCQPKTNVNQKKCQLKTNVNQKQMSTKNKCQSIIIIYITNHNCDTISNHEIPGHSKLPTYYDFIFYDITELILLLVFISILVLQDIPIIKIRESIYKDCYFC